MRMRGYRRIWRTTVRVDGRPTGSGRCEPRRVRPRWVRVAGWWPGRVRLRNRAARPAVRVRIIVDVPPRIIVDVPARIVRRPLRLAERGPLTQTGRLSWPTALHRHRRTAGAWRQGCGSGTTVGVLARLVLFALWGDPLPWHRRHARPRGHGRSGALVALVVAHGHPLRKMSRAQPDTGPLVFRGPGAEGGYVLPSITATAARRPVDRSHIHLQTFVVLAKTGFRRYSTYRQATLAGIFTNSVFGFLRCYVMLAVAACRGGASGSRVRRHAPHVRAGTRPATLRAVRRRAHPGPPQQHPPRCPRLGPVAPGAAVALSPRRPPT